MIAGGGEYREVMSLGGPPGRVILTEHMGPSSSEFGMNLALGRSAEEITIAVPFFS